MHTGMVMSVVLLAAMKLQVWTSSHTVLPTVVHRLEFQTQRTRMDMDTWRTVAHQVTWTHTLLLDFLLRPQFWISFYSFLFVSHRTEYPGLLCVGRIIILL